MPLFFDIVGTRDPLNPAAWNYDYTHYSGLVGQDIIQ